MFQLWHNENTLLQENLTEASLYAVAYPKNATAFFGGTSPQGQYPAFPLSASECVEAKPVMQVTDTKAATAPSQPGTNFPQSESRRSERLADYAGRTGSVAYRSIGMSLRGNDGILSADTTVLGASAIRSAIVSTVLHG